MDIWPFVVYTVVTSITPGPNNIMILSQAMNFGFTWSLRFISGVLVAITILMAGACFLNFTLSSFVPKAQPILEKLGAVYILFLAYKVATSKPPENGAAGTRGRLAFFSGLTLQLVNAKLLLYCLTVASAFMLPLTQDSFQLMLLILLATALNLVSQCTWALAGSVFQRFFQRWFRPVNLAMAASLVYIALSILHVF